MAGLLTASPGAYPSPRAVLELLKPVTWFPPMWAFLCGVVSIADPADQRLWIIAAGVLLTGPLVCAASQAINDWFDRHVDAINEPQRPIPSGRMPGRWGLIVACLWSSLSLLLAWTLGSVVFVATVIGVALAWAYSAPPIRLKQNGWWGNAAVGLCYEGLPWITGAALLAGGQWPGALLVTVALLYSLGAHGIMTLNDFKSIDGDTRTGVRSLPVQLGPERAARLACGVMLLAQAAVTALLVWHGAVLAAVLIAGLMLGQLLAMRRLLGNPRRFAPWYNATGIGMYVLGMLITAIALRQLS